MNLNNINLEMTAGRVDQFPKDDIPEIAFVGRSNVGKSSLLNTMLNRKALARTSAQPGKTRTINFYNVDNLIRFVDLPGYGFASASKNIQQSWLKVIDIYLNERPNLKCIALLLDIRRIPNAEDKLMLDFIIDTGYEFLLPITKKDKLGKNDQIKNIKMIKKELKILEDDKIIPFSSHTREGRDELWDKIKKIYNIE